MNLHDRIQSMRRQAEVVGDAATAEVCSRATAGDQVAAAECIRAMEAAADAEEFGGPVDPRRIRAARRRAELSLEQVARSLGVSTATVRDWERGRVEPRGLQLAALLRWLEAIEDDSPDDDGIDD